jgi:hypothetical protein
MKQLFSLSVALLMGYTLAAQTQTLFNEARIVGAFASPLIEMGLDDYYNTSVGGGGGLLINSFFLGAYGMGSLDFEELLSQDGAIDQIELGHGGLWLGFSVPTHKLLHFYGSTRVGWGALDIRTRNAVFDELDQVFVVTPEAGIELNVTRWFKLAGTVGYRYLEGINAGSSYTNDDFRGAFAGVTLRFGSFGRPNRW